MLQFFCSSCRCELSVPYRFAGAEGPCPSCHALITAPIPAALNQVLATSAGVLAPASPDLADEDLPYDQPAKEGKTVLPKKRKALSSSASIGPVDPSKALVVKENNVVSEAPRRRRRAASEPSLADGKIWLGDGALSQPWFRKVRAGLTLSSLAALGFVISGLKERGYFRRAIEQHSQGAEQVWTTPSSTDQDIPEVDEALQLEANAEKAEAGSALLGSR